MGLFSLGEGFEPIGDFVEAFFASGARHARIHVGVFVGLTGDGGLEIVFGAADGQAGGGIADWFETLAKAERSHAGRFQRALDEIK